MKQATGIIATILATAALVFGLAYGGFALYRYFAPKYEGVRYDVHKESQAYRDGMVRRLRNLQLEYLKASAEHRQVIASVIRHEAADFPEAHMPEDLRRFIKSIEQ